MIDSDSWKKIWQRLKQKESDIKRIINTGSSFERWTQREALLACRNDSLHIEVRLPNNHRAHCDFYIGEMDEKNGQAQGIWIEQKQIWTWHYTLNRIRWAISSDMGKHKQHGEFYMFIEVVLQPDCSRNNQNFKKQLLEKLSKAFNDDNGKWQWQVVFPTKDSHISNVPRNSPSPFSSPLEGEGGGEGAQKEDITLAILNNIKWIIPPADDCSIGYTILFFRRKRKK